ncbi:MAG: extracellular solute-binding protein, partial [Candidatus Portnoybacteria bacterium]|nr:extracellular solute-binding protein [Candidatus Portnoybacteria bacterium]
MRAKKIIDLFYSKMEVFDKKIKKGRKAIVFNLIAPFLIFGLFGSLSAALPGCSEKNEKVELDFWNVYDDSDILNPLIQEFRKEYPNVSINYYKKTPAGYETELVNALAAGRGPDVFAIHNTWLPKHIDKLQPMTDKNLMTLQSFRDSFVDVVYNDFVAAPPSSGSGQTSSEQIYGVALFVDTLALYWNKSILNSAGIAEPPGNWHEFSDAVEKLTKRDEEKNITLAGAAIGGSKNINRATDILALLMMQTGAKMTDNERNQASFDESVSAGDQNYQPGADSLRFYTDFSNPSKKVYTWNEKMHYSIDAFVEGKAAMMINYAYHINTIRAKDPHLQFGVAPVPQPKDAKNLISFANYWGLGVSAASTAAEKKYAWIFLN